MSADVITNYDPKPIPDRRFDWEAHFDGEEESGSGFGATLQEAIEDLAQSLNRRICRVDGTYIEDICETCKKNLWTCECEAQRCA